MDTSKRKVTRLSGMGGLCGMQSKSLFLSFVGWLLAYGRVGYCQLNADAPIWSWQTALAFALIVAGVIGASIRRGNGT